MVQLSCDFEVDTCVWNDTAPDGYSWTRTNGSTPSLNTGPSGNHSTGSGYYIFTEASGSRSNKLHQLKSPLFSLEQDATLSFAYHMYGSSMGTLSFEAYDNETGWSTLWSRSGDKGNDWLDAAVVLPASATQASNGFSFTRTYPNGYCDDMAELELGASFPAGYYEHVMEWSASGGSLQGCSAFVVRTADTSCNGCSWAGTNTAFDIEGNSQSETVSSSGALALDAFDRFFFAHTCWGYGTITLLDVWHSV
ncbi:hypothetical protein EMIHUDRAFT_233206 [Emiliania huxleyi CCMP1516]|uniref:MAM domain-containing protein n=2 Tax=Emiliania huxleyi TaxID=2903 RepID=A0A0D3K391_EMIH1|nr:hypothetical protein EMIHUDRAFT_233206 [Emiliania huxleyi CCMP1516]EOD30226.1 hypothetical protein EMIHUDRAFT_233206 [Emiliania huxleyi CCMP1516]|eukprot:XP_005782655.1 hypothetical protein EMIHUDRAFT_233206 [Emiliania huxleyi CCMP1516]